MICTQFDTNTMLLSHMPENLELDVAQPKYWKQGAIGESNAPQSLIREWGQNLTSYKDAQKVDSGRRNTFF